MNGPRERRYKVVALDEQCVFDMFRLRFRDVENVILWPGLPDDVEVADVNYNSVYACWFIRLYHPSFPVVQVGEVPTMVDAVIKPVVTKGGTRDNVA